MGLFKVIQEQLSKVQQENRESQKERTAPGQIFDKLRDQVKNMEKKQQKTHRSQGSGGGLFSVLKEKLDQVRQENHDDPEVETAEPSIFDRMRQELEKLEAQKEAHKTTTQTHNETDYDFGSEPSVGSNESGSEEFGNVFDGIGDDIFNKETGNVVDEVKDNVFNKETGNVPPTYEQPPSYEQPKAETGKRSIQIGGMAMTSSMGGSLAMRIDPNMGAGQNSTRVPDGSQLRILEYSDQNKINLDGQICGWYKVDFNGQQGWILDMYLR